ncbi:MAG: acyltransferase family protein [Anaerococcus sp.]|uniref:acyltransferase family protein n=1 Tax=Anaerococcus sp. TaxID=1872515 RepID=UPI0025887BCC|nr:acyltransferase family protein [Anaerococcus sp.]MDU1864154.1 acyltransferase family protein [Anaerococcus sp.]MDU3211106.1 acyltransferase family protein [Anaerococcus sp.]
MRKKRKVKKEYYTLNILRAVAFLGVSLFHRYAHFVPGGYLAVIIFLTLSGFLTMRSSENKKEVSLKSIIRKFISIMSPVYFIMAIAMVISIFFARDIFDDSIKSVIPVALNFENIRRILAGDDYFNQLGNFNIFLHMWYVSIYMQFIAIFTLIDRLITRNNRNKTRLILYSIITIISFSLLIYFAKSPKNITRIYYGIDTRISAFSLGIILFLLGSYLKDKINLDRNTHKIINMGLGVLTILPFFFIDGSKISSYKVFFIAYTILVGLLILSLYNYEDMYLKDIKSHNIPTDILLYIGDRSYFLYIWQYIVQIFFVYFIVGKINSFVSFLLEIIVLVMLSELTYKIFKRKSKQVNFLIISAGLLIVLSIVSLFIGNKKDKEIKELKKEIESNQSEIEKRNKASINNKKSSTKTSSEQKNKTNRKSRKKYPSVKTIDPNFKAKDYDNFDFTDKEKEYLADLHVTAIGDSVIINADSYIRKYIPNFYLDGKVGRDMVDGPAVLSSVKQNVGLGDIVIVSLGSNGSANEKDLKQIMEISDGRDVYFVNTSHTQSYMDYVNKCLKEFTDKTPKAHLVDWREFVKDRPDLLAPDRTHPNVEGSDYFGKLIMRKILNVNKVRA